MKRILSLLILLVIGFSFSQETQYNLALDNNGSTSGNSRAPQGAYRYERCVYLITATEMASSGLVNGDVLTGIGFNYSAAQNIATTGNFIVYLQNTADATNLKSTTWATAITGMTTVSNTTLTIPAASGQFNHLFTGGSSFTYTGGGIYVAFEYQNASGTLATTANVALCSTTLTSGLKSAQSTTALPTTLTASNWRPMTYLAKSVPCAAVNGLSAGAYTDTSAIVNWTENVNAQLEWGLYPYTQGGGGSTATVSATNTYTISSLTAGKAYDVYIRKNCGSGVYSEWRKVSVGTSNTAPVTSYPYSQNFEPAADQAYLYNLGWGNQPTGNVGSWSWFDDSAYSQSSTFFLGSIVSATTAQNCWVFSRPLAMTAGNTYTISYYYATFSTAATTGAMSFNVGINTTNSGTGVTQLASHPDYNNTTYVQESLPFIPTVSGNYYVGFQNNTPARTGITTNNYIFIDTFNVTETLGVDDIQPNATASYIYPNPVKSSFQVKLSEDFNAAQTSLIITDLSGKKVKEFSVADSYTISELPKGVYLLNVTDGKKSENKKLIKE